MESPVGNFPAGLFLFGAMNFVSYKFVFESKYTAGFYGNRFL